MWPAKSKQPSILDRLAKLEAENTELRAYNVEQDEARRRLEQVITDRFAAIESDTNALTKVVSAIRDAVGEESGPATAQAVSAFAGDNLLLPEAAVIEASESV